MTVWLDAMGHLWCADKPTLHAFAARLKMKREWFQDRPVLYHYDLMTRSKRDAAVRGGAVLCTARELVVKMRAG